MMSKKYWRNMCYKILIACLVIVTSVQAQTPSQFIKNTLEKFQPETQISVAYSKQGNDEFLGFKQSVSGIESVENSTKLFQIGSISKVFTSILLAELSLQNRVKLDQDLKNSDHFDTLIKNSIQLKSLANHTSGLPRLPNNFAESAFKNQSNPYYNYGQKELFAYLKQLKLGEKTYQYSNLGVGLLGYSLEQITETPYEKLLQTEILKPLNLTQTTSDPKEMSQIIKGLDASGQLTSYWTFDALKGVGDIYSSAKDMLKFSKAVMSQQNKAINLSLEPTFTINERQQIGLGWNILTTREGKTWYWHNGAVGGFTATMVVNPETKTSVIVLSNVSAYHPNMQLIDKLCFDLMQNLEKN